MNQKNVSRHAQILNRGMRYRAISNDRFSLASFSLYLFIAIFVLASIFFLLTKGPLAANASTDKRYREHYISIELKAGDSISSIADTYHTNPNISRRAYIDTLIEMNHLTSDQLISGASLVVPMYELLE